MGKKYSLLLHNDTRKDRLQGVLQTKQQQQSTCRQFIKDK